MARSVAVAESRGRSPDDRSRAEIEHDEALKRYVQMFEESEQATQTAREKAERDRDYYDGKQWTEDEAVILRKRGQPVIALNVIRSRINYHLGMEKKQRRDPKAFAKGPQDMETAEVATDALRYAMDRTGYHTERSAVWENIKIEGLGALECSLKPRSDGNYDVEWKRIPWDRFFADPHSARPDFSDARFLGQVQWMDEDEVLAEYPDSEEAISRSMASASTSTLGTTYEDRPRWQLWADPKRRRLRVVQLWHKIGKDWHFCEYVQGGILSSGPSPYVDDDGDTLCGIVAESCYVDRENNRYGEVRDLVDPQDEVNKRRSKALHAVNTNLVITEHGAIPDGEVEKARREANRPDGFIVVAPGRRFEIDRNTEMAAGQAELLNQAQQHIASTGPNMALLGKGTESQSGRAIQAQQQGGLIELGDGLDVLRRLDLRVFQLTWFAIKRYWQAEMWIRITDDENAPTYVGLNQVVQGPMGYQMQNAIGEMHVDIEIEDVPDMQSLEGETYQATMDAISAAQGNPMLLRFVAEIHPGLQSSKKKRLIKLSEELQQQAMQAQQAAAQAEQAKQQTDKGFKTATIDLKQQEVDLRALQAGLTAAQRATEPVQQPQAAAVQ